MRRIFFALICGLLAISNTTAQGRDDKKQYDLLGPVKTVEVGRIDYPLKDGKGVAGERHPHYRITFNEAGRKSEEITYELQDGSIVNKVVYAYDKEGRLQGYETFSRVADKTLSKPQKTFFKLDEKGNVVEHVYYQPDGTLGSRFLYKYDAKGNKLEEISYSWNGTRMGKLINTYDEAGHQLTQTSYNEDDSVAWKSTNTYNSKGQKIEWLQVIGGIVRYRETYNYDDKNRLVEQETFEYNQTPGLRASHSPEPGKIIYTYNDKERTKEVAIYNEDGSLKEKTFYQLDERGNEVERKAFKADGSMKNTEVYWYDKGKLLRSLSGIESAKFEYDSKGNWTRKTRQIQPANSPEPEAYSTEYRDITYY